MSIDEILRSELNPRQYEAAVDPAREVLCLACAGSGKSRTLAFRIARLIAQGESPDGLVAFTFTEKAAESIRRQVSKALIAADLDPTVMGAMFLGTIHAYCQQILVAADGIYRQFDVLDENRMKLYLMSRFNVLGLGPLLARSPGRSYFETISQVAGAWTSANDELVDLRDVQAEDRPLGDALVAVRENLWADRYIDFSLMIRFVVEGLQNGNPGVGAAVAKLRHLMCDEYQDVNPAQEGLIRLLHERTETLFAVGDDDQAIYAWRGADVRNITTFETRYGSGIPHTLTENYRSTQAIVRASNAFIAAELGPSRIAKTPVAHCDHLPQDLRVLWFQNRDAEAQWVADRILALLGTAYDDNGDVRGLTPADFAIIMRSTRGSHWEARAGAPPRHAPFTRALAERGIRISLEAGGSPFERPQVAALRHTFELLRGASPDRTQVQQCFNEQILPAYPDADFDAIVRVLTAWGRRVHRPEGSPRVRLYPQQLLYGLLEAFRVRLSQFDDDVMRDIGLFSKMILDVETVYLSVDSKRRFGEVLNFLGNVAESGYDVSTDDLVQRPDAVVVSTVHKVKGLEFPCAFVVDVEARRFPGDRKSYAGWLPDRVLANALARGAYQKTADEEARLFYTAVTRAERFLYVTGAEDVPGRTTPASRSRYSLHLAADPAASDDPTSMPGGVARVPQKRRIEDSDYPTSFSEVRYYLQCPKGYQFRKRYGFNPVIEEMFGYGRAIHASIQQLHGLHRDAPPTVEEVVQTVSDTFHLKHVPKSRTPDTNPGAYEYARNRAEGIARDYVAEFGADFRRERQVEATFEIPAANCVISGAIDLLLYEDGSGNILYAEIIDFKTMEGGERPTEKDDLDWTELALQVQLYARAARQVLGQNARTGSVHLLKDNRRVEVPVTQEAVDAALANVEWAVKGILGSDFPMRPHLDKCAVCDFRPICPALPEEFGVLGTTPPAIQLPDGGARLVSALSRYRE